MTSPLLVASVSGAIVLALAGRMSPRSSPTTPVGAPCCQQDTVRAIAPPTRPLPPERASADTTRFSFIVYGDTRGRNDGQSVQVEHGVVVDAMLQKINALDAGPDAVRFVLQSGDAVVDGRDAAQWNVSFISLINRLTTVGGVPYFLAPGNHDVTTASALSSRGRQQGLQNYLRATAQLIPPENATRRLNGYPTYAFGYGNTFVLAFDSNIAEDDTQFAWVEQQLRGLDRSRYRHVVVFSHHPPLSSGPHGGSTVERPAEAVRRRYLPLFRELGVRLMVTGHEHFLEHWIERYKSPAGAWQRMDHVISGGGGAPIYTWQGAPDLGRYRATSRGVGVKLEQLVRPGTRERDNPYHFLVVYVNGGELSVEFVGVDGKAQPQPYKRPRLSLIDAARAP